jgi:predicted DNA-binding transcriptional regulator YafY
MISARVDELRTPARARAAVQPDYVQMLRWILGTQLKVGPARPDGRIDVEIAGHDESSLARELAGFGAALEILEPQSMRDLLVEIADELRATYS